jgi:hypothetical protein
MKAALAAAALLSLVGCGSGSMDAPLLDANQTALDVGSVDGGSASVPADGGVCPLDGGTGPACLPTNSLPVPGCTWAARCCEDVGVSSGLLCHDWYTCGNSPPKEVSFWADDC